MDAPRNPKMAQCLTTCHITENRRSNRQGNVSMDALRDHSIQTLRSLVDASGLFDKAWYVRRYGDVIEAGIEPFEDFILFGMFLQRDPGPGFNTEAYVRHVPESLEHPDGPLAHYFMSRGSSYPLTLQATVGQGLQGVVPEQKKWIERLSGSVDVGLQSCEIKDFRFTARGWVIDKDRPGAVNRLRIRMGNVTSAPVVARQIILEPNSDDGPQFSGIFTATSIVPDHLVGTDLIIEVIDTDTTYRVVPDINPAPVNESARNMAILPNDRIIGRVDRATPLQVAGWAFVDATRSAEGIELVLKINGEPLAVTGCNIYRSGIQKVRGGDGYFGFQFNLPDNLWTGARLEYEVISSQGDCRLINKRGTIIPEGGLWFPSPKPVHHQPFELKLDLEAETSISVIILNRNGRVILKEMLESAEATGDLVRAEWIVVDHQSSDGSVEMCERFAAAGFDVKVIRRNGNASFSESNNFGVNLARGRTLIFANNDLLFSAPVMDRVIASLRDRRVGILGAELVDYVAAPEWDEAGDGYAVQHHGVYFKSRPYNGFLRPFEARASEEQLVQEGFHYLRPAVTAAFIAMRREVFQLIGGFDEAYSYGLEDVDLSLKVTRELGLSSVLDAGIRIIHRHGFSRKKDTHAHDRNLRNNHVLNSSWGVWLRSQIRQCIPLQSQFWTGRRPIVGFTVSARDMENSGDYFTALELGKALQRTMDVHLVYLSGEESKDLADLDILINVSPRFNLHDVQSLNPYCIRINWVRQHFDAWLERESIYSYDHTICSSRRSADLFQHHMASAVHVMPIASDTAQFAQGKARPELKCDYCFTGSYFGVKREIEFNLDPSSIMGQGAIFGKDWEATSLAPIARGPLAYVAMPDVYASTRVVIDDGIFATALGGA